MKEEEEDLPDCYDPNNIVPVDDGEFSDPGEFYESDVVETKDDKLFHIGQSYEKKGIETLYCKICGGNSFNVGKGSYYTGIKCVKCEWEVCIHEG